MSGDAFRQIAGGEPLSIHAVAWNRVLRATAFIEKLQNSSSGGRFSMGSDFARCWVLNDSGETVNRFGVLGITSVLYTPSENLTGFKDDVFAFRAEKPSGKMPETFCITLQPIRDGEVGRCQLIGIMQVRLVGSSKIKVAGPIGQDIGKLSTHRFGSAAVLYDEGDEGDPLTERWGVVLLGGANGLKLQGVLNGTLASPSNGWTGSTASTMSVYVPKESSASDDDYFTSRREFEDSGVSVQIVNRDPSLTGTSGAYVKAEWIDGEFSPYWVGCP